jgi:hypothetical protein
MAIVRQQIKSVGADGVTSVSLTFDSSTAGGNFIALYIPSYYRDATNSPQDYSASDNKSNTYTKAFESAGVTGSLECWYAENISGGASHQVTISSPVGSYFMFAVAEYSGVATSSAFDTSAVSPQDTPATTYTSGSTASTAQADELLFGAVFSYNGTVSVTPDSPWSAINTRTGTFLHMVVTEQVVSSTGAYANTGSISGDTVKTWSGIATFKASAGGGGGATPVRVRRLPLLGVG